MKRKIRVSSIYVRLTLIFLGIWWLMNILTFGLIINTMSQNPTTHSFIQQKIDEGPTIDMRRKIGDIFLLTNAVGTIIILLVISSIVRPIRKLSEASKQVAKGNFDVEVKIKSADELGQLTTDFNSMVKELKSIEKLRAEFVSNVSHEFRTPMTSIKGFASLLGKADVTVDQRLEYSEIIVDESERLIELSSNLLKLSEIEHKIIRETAIPFSLDEQIRKTILLLEPQWQKKNIQFDLNLAEISYRGEENLMSQVWLNLISNAIKFSNDFGKIEISASIEETYFNIIIKDFGIGIAATDIPQIFQQFYKSDSSRTQEGNGLGLAIVQKIIAISGGEITCESELGVGTQFNVKLTK